MKIFGNTKMANKIREDLLKKIVMANADLSALDAVDAILDLAGAYDQDHREKILASLKVRQDLRRSYDARAISHYADVVRTIKGKHG